VSKVKFKTFFGATLEECEQAVMEWLDHNRNQVIDSTAYNRAEGVLTICYSPLLRGLHGCHEWKTFFGPVS
jgi:hypothetical protein